MQYAKSKVYWLMLIGVIFSILKVIYLFVNPEIPITTLLLHIGFILIIYYIKVLCFSLEFKYISIKYDQYNVFKF